MDVSKIKKEIERLRQNNDISEYAKSSLLAELSIVENQGTHKWIKYSWENPISHPTGYGRYFVQRKDGKVHWEIWNGSGWSCNQNTIMYWAKITNPIK